MPYANNQGVRIYYEVEGQGPPLVLMHGGTDALEVFRMVGYVDALQSDYRLIMIDTRGHGASDKPHEPDAYRVTALVADVVAMLEDLAIDRAHYYGFSMGGFIAYGIARNAPNRFYSLIFGDATLPWERDPDLPAQLLGAFRFNETMDEYLAGMKAMLGQWWSPEYEAIQRSNDRQALAAGLMAKEGRHSYGFGESAPYVTMPCLFTASESGATPEVRKYIEGMPNATFVRFPGLSHADAFARIDLVVPHIRRFLAEVGEC